MARLKFLVFALVALGLWGYHLTMIAPLAVTSSQEQAQSAVAGAAGPVAVALESQRSLTQAVALKVATNGPAMWNAGPKAGAKPEAPSVDRFAAVRTAATEALPAELKEQLFIAVSNDVGLLAAKGSGEPASAVPEGVDLAAVTAAGAIQSVEGASYLLFSAPLAISDKNEVRQAGSVVVGLPVLPDGKVIEQAQKSLGLVGLALVADGKPVLLSGDKASLDVVLTKVKAGATTATSSGAVRELGPLALPLMVDQPVHTLGSRQAIAGTPFEVAAVASSRAALDALAAYQVFALGGLAGLLLLTIVFTIIMGGGHEEGPAMVLPPPMPLPPRREDGSTGLKPAFTPAPEPELEPAPPPEASPDDFHFPASTSSAPPPPPPQQSSPSAFAISSPSSVTGAAPVFTPEPESDPFANSAPPPPPPPARPPPPVATSEAAAYQPARGLMDDDEGQRTVAYPAFKPPPAAIAPPPPPPPVSDPFALAAAQQGDEGTPMGEDNPDATRVAAVPAELIKAARAGASGNTGERPALKAGAALPKVAAVAPAVAGANDEERHFQDVFRDFVATREKCREPSDGLTYDKFKAKLLKNKEQLVAKYQCRTVRFQVYVKDGKAALKATPVKE